MAKHSMPASEGKHPIIEGVSLAGGLVCHARVQLEQGWYWAEIPKLPGCFASGRTTEELTEALEETVAIYLADGDEPLRSVSVAPSEGWRITVEPLDRRRPRTGHASSGDGLSAARVAAGPIAHPSS